MRGLMVISGTARGVRVKITAGFSIIGNKGLDSFQVMIIAKVIYKLKSFVILSDR